MSFSAYTAILSGILHAGPSTEERRAKERKRLLEMTPEERELELKLLELDLKRQEVEALLEKPKVEVNNYIDL